MLEVLSMIDKHGVQRILKLIFTNTFKNRSLWSVTSTLVPFDSFAGIGLTLQTMTKFAYYFTTLLTAQESKHGQTNAILFEAYFSIMELKFSSLLVGLSKQ